MRLAITTLLLSLPSSAQVLESFEHGNEALYVVAGLSGDSFDVTPGSARNGAFGGTFYQPAIGAAWRARFDVNTAPGNVYQCYFRARNSALAGRSYVGIGATATGAYSAVLAPNTNQILIQDNAGWGFLNIAAAPFTFAPDTWYLVRLTWSPTGDMTFDLYNEAGTALLATTGTVATGNTTPGGFVVRGFTDSTTTFHDIDDFGRAGSFGPGTRYCSPAVANSTGAPAEIGASGTASVAANDLTLTASALPLNSFGFLLTSRNQGSVSQPGGSQGVLCLGGQIGRYVGPGQIRNSGATGMYSLQVNLTQTPTPQGPVAVSAGETWNFQWWYRDAVGGAATSNFTDGLSVGFN